MRGTKANILFNYSHDILNCILSKDKDTEMDASHYFQMADLLMRVV